MIYKQKLFCFVSATNTNEKFIKIQISMTMRTFAIQVELFISVLLILIRGGKKKKFPEGPKHPESKPPSPDIPKDYYDFSGF